MLHSLVLQTAAGIGGIYIAVRFVPNVEFTGSIPLLLITGAILGIINVIVKPILNALTMPLRILTLGFSTLVVNMLMVLAVDIYFEELIITGLLPLIYTTLIVWILSMTLNIFGKGKVQD
jgi:putative membrane protein